MYDSKTNKYLRTQLVEIFHFQYHNFNLNLKQRGLG